ncbi:MAG TPA: protein kinase, partial [Lacipirellulaceae bacterium]|nr:protein kinase [Lacipirellulaceae bacterium]
MRTCHACKRDLDTQSLVTGKCPHCGAVLRKLAQRTIDDARLPTDADKSQDIELIVDDSDDDLRDTDQGGATIELDAFLKSDEFRKTDLPSEPPSPKSAKATRENSPTSDTPTPPELPKFPTIADRSDMTMEFQALPGAQAGQEEPVKATRRSTHTFENDKTIDLEMASEDASKLDSQWRGTFDLEAKQGQTIRQHETVTGFRSSLPVKSRYVREKRKAGAPAPKSTAEVPDYELLDIIGEGGMGVVYAAHQSSIARTVAVKMLKPSARVREEQRDKFISEAVVTGELDHPNIVPIYDLGSNDQGALFYSMKRVRGTPWDKVIAQKQLDENLSILLRVADAVAFAHAGGVIHRDLKPENVMLGDYGEVLVMDWGLARITPEFAHIESVYQAESLGGTPAYMSPEMTKGPIEQIDKTSDVYLLGAILYEIIGGVPPHSGRDVMQCLMAASQNRIDPIRYDGELKEIALKAMATQQADRYQTVKEFQEAVRIYQSHSESLVLSAHANQNLQKARAENDYQLFARALYGFQESLALWKDNHRARLLLTETQRDYANSALDKGDLDLAASLLDAKQPEHQALFKRIDKARAERNARQRRLRLAKQAVAGLIVGIIATVSIAYFQVSRARDVAVEQKQIAEDAKRNEETQKNAAIEAKKLAEDAKVAEEKQKNAAVAAKEEASQQRDIAQDQKEKAVAAERVAVSAKQAEEYEAYIAQIGLANAKINENAYDYALDLLNASKPELRNWEWGRLTHLCELDAANYKFDGPVNAVAYAPDGRTFAAGDLTGKVTVRETNSGKQLWQGTAGQYVFSLAYSPDGRYLAIGTNRKNIDILDLSKSGAELKDRMVRTLSGHTDGVLTVRFSPDGKQLLSGSYDNTARLWDVATGAELQALKGHSWW